MGVIGGYPYLVLFGAVSFMLFALISFLTLAGDYFSQRLKWGTPESGVAGKIETLRRKIEALERRSSGGQPFSGSTAQDSAKEKELERGIEELRTIVTALSKAVENPGRRW
jgi:hypothetical protein